MKTKWRTRNINNWIYVTGIGRSGTTFIGKVLSLPLSVDYIHEPFNPQCGLHGMNRWDPYVRPSLDSPKEKEFHERVKNIFTYDFELRTLVPQHDSPLKQTLKRIIGSRGPVYLTLAKLNPFHTAAILKAPIGLFLTEYMHVHFQVKPVIIIKHPVSVIASLQRLGWSPKPAQVLNQPYLLEDYFAEDMDFVHHQWPDPALAIAAYWRIVHKVLLLQAKLYPSWQIITHEALSNEPVYIFRSLYNSLDLQWTPRIERQIRNLTEHRAAAGKKAQVHNFTRSSKDIFKARLNSVPKEMRRKIFDIVQDVALQVYSRNSFDID